ncbi:hypothetical protein NKH77_51860 [Streptomyces sp. M19]
MTERVWQRMAERLANERVEAGSPVVQVAGRAVRLVAALDPDGRGRAACGVPARPCHRADRRRPGRHPLCRVMAMGTAPV